MNKLKEVASPKVQPTVTALHRPWQTFSGRVVWAITIIETSPMPNQSYRLVQWYRPVYRPSWECHNFLPGLRGRGRRSLSPEES